MVDMEAGEATMLDTMAIMVDTMAIMADSTADFISALARDFGLDTTGAITRIIGELR
jgi:hypothetical protein